MHRFTQREQANLIAEFKFYLNSHSKFLASVLEFYNLSYNDYVILLEIYKNEGITQYDLSKKLEMSAQRLNQIVKKLEDEALLSKIKEKESRGKKSLLIKDKGMEIIERITKEVSEKAGKILSDRDREDLTIIGHMLKRVNDELRNNTDKNLL